MDMSTVISEGQKVFEEAVSSVVSAALENMVGGRVESMARGKERGDQAEDYSATHEVTTSGQDEGGVFEALEAESRGLCWGLWASVTWNWCDYINYVACMSAVIIGCLHTHLQQRRKPESEGHVSKGEGSVFTWSNSAPCGDQLTVVILLCI